MSSTVSKSPRLWSIVLGAAAIGLLLAGCAPPVSVPDSDLRPTVEALVEEFGQMKARLPETPGLLVSPAMLEIAGLDKAGLPATLQIAAADGVALPRLNDQAMLFLQQSYSQTLSLEYALIFNGPQNWLLYYAQPPAQVVTPTQVQMHVLELADARQSLFKSSPGFTVSAMHPISTTDTVAPIPLPEGIALITDSVCPSGPPPGRPICREAAFLLLSAGEAGQQKQILVIFGPVQPDGSVITGFPGGCDDLLNYCATSHPPFWCGLAVTLCGL